MTRLIQVHQYFLLSGTVRNDIGAYGGPGSSLLPQFSLTKVFFNREEYEFNLTLPGNKVDLSIPLTNKGSEPLVISDIRFKENSGNELSILNASPLSVSPYRTDTIKISWTPSIENFLMIHFL